MGLTPGVFAHSSVVFGEAFCVWRLCTWTALLHRSGLLTFVWFSSCAKNFLNTVKDNGKHVGVSSDLLVQNQPSRANYPLYPDVWPGFTGVPSQLHRPTGLISGFGH